MKLLGFAPDLDDRTEGVITDCEMLEPTVKGMKGAPSLVSTGTSALISACQGASLNLQLDGTSRLFIGVATKLYESTSLTDVSRATGGAYTGTADTHWVFAQMGNVALATNKSDAMQKSVGSGAFSDLAGAPKAKFIDTVQPGFVMAANYNDGTDTVDGWFCSAYNDYTDWTPDIGTQCANGRLFDSPGEITGLKSLGDGVVAYKLDAIYVGQYVGAPFIFSWQLISAEIGAVSHEAVVDIGNAHVFMGRSDIWLFDGTRPRSISEGIRDWFFNEQLNAVYSYKTIGSHDKAKSIVYFYYVSKNASSIDSCLVYNYKSGKWSRANRAIEAVLEYRVGGYTYSSFTGAYATYSAIPTISYGSPFWTASSPVSAVFDTTHTLKSLTGTSTSSSLTGGWFGDDLTYMTVQRVTPRFINSPDTATLTNYYVNNSGDNQLTGSTTTMNRGRFGVYKRAKWQKMKLSFTGDYEITDYIVQAVRAGSEGA